MIWEFLWKYVLLFTLFGYAILVVIVIIGGSSNVIDMLKDLKSESD
jgi:hypothetical protein